jgi:hypothetical protein
MARTWGGASTDRVEIPNHTAINNLGALTIVAFTYKTGAGGNSLGRIAAKVTGANAEWQLYWNDTAGAIQFDANRWTSVGQWRGTGISANTWDWWGVTYSFSATTNKPVFYKNGSSVSRTDITTPTGTAATVSGADYAMGNVGGSSAARNWAGRLMHIALWNRILSAGEMMGVYKNGPMRHASGLVSWCPLFGVASPEPNYAVLGDATRNGTVTGTTTGAANVPAKAPFWF